MTPSEFATKALRRLTGRRPKVRDYPFRDTEQLIVIKALEFGANTIVDVGANEGQYGANLRELGWTRQIVSFEPQKDAHAVLHSRALDDPLWFVPPAMALGSEDGRASINISQNSLSSSLLPIEQRSVSVIESTRYVTAESIVVRKLDDVIPKDCLGPFAVKIDTQGFEMEVLKGGGQTLQNTVVLNLEMSLCPVYTGGANYVELLQLVTDAGFRCIAITEAFVDVPRNEVLQVDGTFIRI